MHFSASANAATKHQTAFQTNFRPRVERSGAPATMYIKAKADARPGSIAWARPENHNGSVSIGHTLSSTSSFGLATSSSYKRLMTDFKRPPVLIPSGEKRNLYRVDRIGDNHFTFTRGKATLDPGPGVIRDRDTVESVAAKLKLLYPEELPSLTSMGDAAPPGSAPVRSVRPVFAAANRFSAFADAKPIGPQCLQTDFKKHSRPVEYFVAMTALEGLAPIAHKPVSAHLGSMSVYM